MVTLEQIAHEQAARATVRQMATDLESLFGRRLTAATIGIVDPKAVGRYASGAQVPDAEVERHLRAAYHVAALLGQAESPPAIRAWFLGMNPELGDRAPASLIIEEPEQVLQAARLFVSSG